jgi:tetratricopeptide (TPR) repeat protein
VDRLYPETGDPHLRRLALEEALDYFPGDRTAFFRVGVRLAILDWNAGRAAQAHARLDQLLGEFSGKIERDLYAWAEVVDGKVLAELGRIPEALQRFDRVALEKALPAERREAAATFDVDLRAKDSPQAAVVWLDEAAANTGLAGPEVEGAELRLLLLTRQDDEVEQRLTEISQDPKKGDAALIEILAAAQAWNSRGDKERFGALVNTVARVRPDPGEALRSAIARGRMAVATSVIQSNLVKALSAKPLSDWFRPAAADSRTELQDFARAVDQAKKKSDPERCLRLSLRALASHGADEGFARRIWETAGYADWVERVRPSRIDGRVCTLLLDLCDQLPPANPYLVEAKFLRAERLARMGDARGERAVLTDVLAIPDLSADYLAPACRKLGANLEAAGDFRQALEVYAQVETQVSSHGTAAQCTLHAVWINLSLGNDPEAVRLLGLLSRAPPAVTRAIPAEAQLRELEALVHTGHEKEFWTDGRAWWSEWVKFGLLIGAPPDLPEYGVPEIADVGGLEDSIRQAVRSGDRAAYLRHQSVLMSAARWQPSLGAEAASLCTMAVRMAGKSGDELRGTLIRMLASPHPPEIAGLRERRLCLAVNYLDVRQPTETLRVAAEFFSAPQPKDNTTRAMHRIRALAAISAGRDYPESSAGLEDDLSNPREGGQRAMAVGLLADLYQRMGRATDSDGLVQRELANPLVMADPQGRADLQSRLGHHDLAAPVPPPVTKWIQSSGLAWYDYAEPESLQDPRVAGREGAADDPNSNFAPVERVKLLLLEAADPQRSPGDRNRAFLEGSVGIVGWSQDYGRMDAMASSVVNDPAIDTQVRLGMMWKVLTILAREGRGPEYDRWRANALCREFSPEFKSRVAWLDREASLDRVSSDAILALARPLCAQKLTASGLLMLEDCLDFLLRVGAVSAAEDLENGSASWTFTEDASASADTARLEFARMIRVAKATVPVHEALASAAIARFPHVPASMPQEYQNARIERDLPELGQEPTFEACLRLISTRQFERDDFKFWGTFFGSLPAGNAPAIGSLIRAALEAAPDDEIRSQLIVLSFTSFDTDDAQVRAEMERAFAPYRKPEEFPASYLSLRLYEIHRDLRLGVLASPETAFIDLNDPRIIPVKQRVCLRFYTQNGARAPLQRTIDQMDPGQILSPGFLTQTVPALELLGNEGELKSAREASARLAKEDVLESWARGNEAAGNAALDLALVLGDKTILPPAWVGEAGSAAPDPLFRGRVLLTQAYLESNWTEVARVSADLTASNPNHYSSYWFLASALHHLGRDSEAAKALGPYLEHAKDELDYPKAVAMAKELAQAGPASP